MHRNPNIPSNQLLDYKITEEEKSKVLKKNILNNCRRWMFAPMYAHASKINSFM